ncbi:hypothetical protein H6G97_41820 [Nostoc flagelliforme FACHB-838]|uniref:Transposase n=1 Tax=Nostoc flagelliforme FACHB-838 TaxID=2692904 RepID=A0ABR8E1P8_9NOSO|nr:hypothetical protein [Nostoc flagelliforme FACHB-838]
MLMSIAGRYGKDSTEYVKAGGVRKSDACGGLRLRIRQGTNTRIKTGAEQAAVKSDATT